MILYNWRFYGSAYAAIAFYYIADSHGRARTYATVIKNEDPHNFLWHMFYTNYQTKLSFKQGQKSIRQHENFYNTVNYLWDLKYDPKTAQRIEQNPRILEKDGGLQTGTFFGLGWLIKRHRVSDFNDHEDNKEFYQSRDKSLKQLYYRYGIFASLYYFLLLTPLRISVGNDTGNFITKRLPSCGKLNYGFQYDEIRPILESGLLHDKNFPEFETQVTAAQNLNELKKRTQLDIEEDPEHGTKLALAHQDFDRNTPYFKKVIYQKLYDDSPENFNSQNQYTGRVCVAFSNNCYWNGNVVNDRFREGIFTFENGLEYDGQQGPCTWMPDVRRHLLEEVNAFCRDNNYDPVDSQLKKMFEEVAESKESESKTTVTNVS